MKNHCPLIIAALLVSPLVGSVYAAESATSSDPSGTWKRSYEWEGSPVEEVVRINLNSGGKVTGTLARNESVKQIKDGEFKDGKLSFSIADDFQGATWTSSYSGGIKDDAVEGTITLAGDGQSYDFPWTPIRSVELADLVGKWEFKIETDDGNMLEPTLEISKDGDKFRPVYTSMQGIVIPVEKLRVEKNDVLFTINAEFDGGSLKVDYKGRPLGDKLSGKLDYDMNGQIGKLEFNAKRPAAK